MEDVDGLEVEDVDGLGPEALGLLKLRFLLQPQQQRSYGQKQLLQQPWPA